MEKKNQKTYETPELEFARIGDDILTSSANSVYDNEQEGNDIYHNSWLDNFKF